MRPGQGPASGKPPNRPGHPHSPPGRGSAEAPGGRPASCSTPLLLRAGLPYAPWLLGSGRADRSSHSEQRGPSSAAGLRSPSLGTRSPWCGSSVVWCRDTTPCKQIIRVCGLPATAPSPQLPNRCPARGPEAVSGLACRLQTQVPSDGAFLATAVLHYSLKRDGRMPGHPHFITHHTPAEPSRRRTP